jgi:cytochrome P450
VTAARRDPDRATGALATLVRAEVEGRALTDEEVAAEVHTLMVTGSDTTEFGVAAALYYLHKNGHAQQQVLDDPSLAAAAFAEALRYDHPTEMLCRTVVKEVLVGGKALQAGQGVLLLWASANRDEAEFPKADDFDIHRRYERSLLFGHGQHKCIGEHIGMQMGTIMLHELIASIRSYAVDVDRVGRRCGEFLKGFNRMPIAVTR